MFNILNIIAFKPDMYVLLNIFKPRQCNTVDAKCIREALNSMGFNYSRIANALGVSVSAVSMVAKRARYSHRVAIAICTALEKHPMVVFPDVPMYHGALMTDREREEALARKLAKINGIRRSA